MPKFDLSCRARWELAQLYLKEDSPDKPGLKLTSREAERAFNRTRLALGLTPIMDVILSGKPMLRARITDMDTVYAFEISKEGIDFLVDTIMPLSKTPFAVAILGDFFEAVENFKKLDKEPVSEAPPYSEGKATDKWQDVTKEGANKALKNLIQAVNDLDDSKIEERDVCEDRFITALQTLTRAMNISQLQDLPTYQSNQNNGESTHSET